MSRDKPQAEELLWDDLLEWAQRYDDRSISDEASWWAEMEAEVTARPENDGEWKASMECAFDAGRQWERMKIRRLADKLSKLQNSEAHK